MAVKAVDPILRYFERVEPGIVLVAHLVFRAAVFTSPLQGWWDPPLLRTLTAVLIGYDVALAWSLRRGTPPPRWVRWALDLTELTFWVSVHTPDEPYSGVWAITAPMILMTTVRYGLLVSGTVAAALTGWALLVRLAADADPFPADTVLYAGMYLIGGQCLVTLLTIEVRRQRRHAQTLWEADVTAAELAGRNEVLTGRGADVIDDLQTTIMRLSGAGVDAAVALRGSVARHKLDLARQTRERALYLRDALDLYAQSVRSREPAVARHVFFDVATDAATCVLTAAQAEELSRQLQRRDLTGVVPVTMAERFKGGHGGGGTGGTALTLAVGGLRHELAGSRPRVALPLAPAAIAVLAMYIARTAVSDSAPVPATLALPMAALTAGYAVACWWIVRRCGPTLEPWLSLGALVPFAVSTAVTTFYAHEGMPRQLTSAGQLLGLAFVLGTITRPRRLVVVSVTAQVGATALAVSAAPEAALRRGVADLVWVAAGYVGSHLLARSIGTLSRDVADDLAGERAAATAAAHRRSREHELAYLSRVLVRGRELARLAAAGPIRSGVETDLGRVEAGLLELRRRGDATSTRTSGDSGERDAGGAHAHHRG